MHTHVLWLATTREAPPIESAHVMWQKLGLETYLLCMLVKQHTGIGNGHLENSVITLQASHERRKPVRSFYLRLGFICHDESADNGLSLTSPGFQEAVKASPKVWVPAETEQMSLFKLYQGWLVLPQMKVDLTSSESPHAQDWKTYQYTKFPCVFPSMKKLEDFFDTRPILKWLSGEPLPLTNCHYSPAKSASTMSGQIIGSHWSSMNMTSWLATDEIHFLFALFMHNQKIEKPYFHVMHPNVTQIIASLYPNMVKVHGHTATNKEQDQYNEDLNKLKDYINTRLDIFEHKFLDFVCNVSNTHWLSVVVISPFLVYGKFLQGDGKHDVSHEEIMRWCVLNSNPHSNEKQINRVQGTCFTKNHASYGMRLFLNVCALYLKAKKQNEKDAMHPN
jgi:hypothetical protein